MATYIPQFAEDVPATDADLAVPILGVRNDSNTTRTNTDGDYGNIALDGSGHVQVVGSLAHDAVDANAPVKIGGQARQTNPTAVADADRVNLTCDDLGRPVVVMNQVRDLVAQNNITLNSTTTETTLLAAGGSGVFHDVTCLIFTNTSATGTRVDIRDDTAGTVRLSVWVPANDIRGVVFQVPMPQTATNKNWTAQCGTSVSDLRVFIQAVKNV